MAATIEELAARVFVARDAAHRAHWKTGSYAAHMALGDLYEALPDSIDEIVEVYQGEFGLIGEFEVHAGAVANVTTFLQAEADWIAEGRDEIARGSTAVQNLIDGLLADYRRAIYKLTQLT
ncbi:MAG TPA: DUF5856 family protein [Burkholderiaceae bacterium]|nr:DUF5856 family protein [Burkholderiaceae bacterium]